MEDTGYPWIPPHCLIYHGSTMESPMVNPSKIGNIDKPGMIFWTPQELMAQELAKAAASRFVGQAGLRTNLWRFVSFLGVCKEDVYLCSMMFYAYVCICICMYIYISINFQRLWRQFNFRLKVFQRWNSFGLWQVSSRARTASPRWAWTDLGRVAQQGSF